VLSTLRQPESPLSILALRPARTAQLDPLKPHAFFLEEERTASGDIASTATILLTNKECPWRCLMCDLWKNTLTYTVPAGAIAKQPSASAERRLASCAWRYGSGRNTRMT
jgi:hypothetical protein